MVSLSTYFSTFSKYSLSTGSKLKENIHYTFNDKNLEALPKGKKSVGDIQKYTISTILSSPDAILTTLSQSY